MKLTSNQFYFLVLLVLPSFLLTACNSDNNDVSDPQSLRDKVISENQTYFFYESDHSIVAVDPINPEAEIIVEPFSETLQAPTIVYESITVDEASRETLAVQRMLLYANEGRIWKVDGSLGDPLNATQVSSENNAYNICGASTANTPVSGAYFRYSLLNAAPDCYAAYRYPNNILHKSVGLNTPIYEAPTLVNSQLFSISIPDADVTFTEYDFVAGASVLGQLVVEPNGDLYWYDPDATPSSAILLASNVTSVKEMAGISNNRKYLNIDGGLYLYEAGSNTLGQRLHTFLTSSPAIRFGSSLPAKNLYIVDGNIISSMPYNGSTQAELIFQDNSIQGDITFFSSNDSHIIFYVSDMDSNGRTYYSLPKSGGRAFPLFEINSWQRQVDRLPYVQMMGDNIFYSDGARFESGIVSCDGQFSTLFPNTQIIGQVDMNLHKPVTTNNFQRYSHFLLLQKTTDVEQYNLLSLNPSSKNIEHQLGTMSPEAIKSKLISTLPNNGNAIFSAQGENSREIFFINLHKDGSLVQITNNNIDENVIESSWVPTN
jgi:hypothetical protein